MRNQSACGFFLPGYGGFMHKTGMKILILFPGKIKPKALAPAQEEYLRRLRAFGVDAEEYRDEKIGGRPPERVKQAEGERILKRLGRSDYLIACDERGAAVETKQLAERFGAMRQGGGRFAGKSRLVIVIGGALGLADCVRDRADETWALSSLVLAGGIARMVLLEGIYRAFTVLDGHPYHND